MADLQARPDYLSLAESWIHALILAIKGLVPLLWLQSKLTPLQFIITGLVGLVAWRASRWISPTPRPGEPDFVEPKVPVVGHLWGLLTRQVNYLSEV